jgi:hypothetical protein
LPTPLTYFLQKRSPLPIKEYTNLEKKTPLAYSHHIIDYTKRNVNKTIE